MFTLLWWNGFKGVISFLVIQSIHFNLEFKKQVSWSHKFGGSLFFNFEEWFSLSPWPPPQKNKKNKMEISFSFASLTFGQEGTLIRTQNHIEHKTHSHIFCLQTFGLMKKKAPLGYSLLYVNYSLDLSYVFANSLESLNSIFNAKYTLSKYYKYISSRRMVSFR